MSLVIALLGALRASLRTRTDLALENLALRQQLVLLRRRSKRPQFGRLDHVLSDQRQCIWWLLAVASAKTSPAAGLALPSVLQAGGDGSLALGLTPVASDPLPDVRRAIPKSDPGILATREELDCLRVHELNFPEIQKQPDPCRFPAQQALQLGHCLSVDPTAQEIEDPSPW